MLSSDCLACIVLASGFSTRFGSNKLLVPYHGKPMIESVLQTARACFHQRILVTRYAEVKEIAEKYEFRVVLHQEKELNDTIRLGVNALLPGTKACVFLPSDQPALTQNSIHHLIEVHREYPDSIVRAADGNQFGSPTLFPSWSFDELRSLPAGCGGKLLLKKYPNRVRHFEVSDSIELMDADTPEQLRILEALTSKCTI